ncbi:hypothetical protein Ae717Ps2_5665c [Pseudonocardia sp. Ae717_Ps2]|uniref:hypothetical protein n=1 Tax=unclassified Pseudonocardia TaxID=2619320 RepID=UPI00094AF7F3|nr:MULTISPECIES: hypothetical protein [unclassified Pseudonocardia]OLM11675.1 hypothetical protein Ae505Ps2_1800c [Pseudonocardia sp. Ae505_Ps2]OLM34769.1 hypothetical protein Ae717Ps2_5665c [Pseudonocardia sp. Ae717_Ps2]
MTDADARRIWEQERPRALVVDGERFTVRPRPAAPGTYDFAWETGPNPDYGFSQFGSGRRPATTEELHDAIRGFLSMIDPETGYIQE